MKLLSHLCLSVFISGSFGCADISRIPNFVLILTDDQGYNDLGCFGGDHVQTPHIDALAAGGARLTSFYAAPVCTPSRAQLMTGCYSRRVDLHTGSNFGVLLASDPKGLHPDEVTVAEVLKACGYATGMVGKWHLGDQTPFLPTRQGFDSFYGIPYSHDIAPHHPAQGQRFNFPPLPFLENETVIELDPDPDMLTTRLADRAAAFIDDNAGHPFFLYLAHPLPHVPHAARPENWPDLTDEERRGIDAMHYRARTKLLAASIGEIDESVGRIVASLRRHGIERDTLIIFATDNGAPTGYHGSNKPLRGGKGSVFEGGVRVPAVAYWPGRIAPGRDIDHILSEMDILPTFAALTGTVPVFSGMSPSDTSGAQGEGGQSPKDGDSPRTLDGHDISPLLLGHSDQPVRNTIYHFGFGRNLVGMRRGDWKVVDMRPAMAPMLFNLADDLGETRDLAAEHPDLLEAMLAEMREADDRISAEARPAGKVENPVPLTLHGQ